MIAIFADIHSNLEALEAVLKNINKSQEIWCLGDIVGYGPNPNQCCQILRQKATRCLLGNHDAALLGRVDIGWFNPLAAQAIKINQRLLTRENKEFLKNLAPKQKVDNLLLVHGSPKDTIFEYLFTKEDAKAAFLAFQEKICFFGHTHISLVFEKEKEQIREIPLFPNKKLFLRKSCRYLINPGSVGQPRDGDARASFLLFDQENFIIEPRRVEYPIRKTQAKMRKLGLPSFLSQRLAVGR